MKTLHFDCFSGCSGDMTVAALIDAGADREAVLAAIESLGLPVKVEFRQEKRGGMAATYFAVQAEPENKHRHLHHIEKIIAAGKLSVSQAELANRIFRRLGEAEAKVHGSTIEKVHFHEVGAADSIVDIVGAAVAFDTLGVTRVTARSVPTGSGTVQCDHGLMPVPAPATAELLVGIPLAPSTITTELTTPTGAAILTTLVQEWTDTPAMTIRAIGVGAGTKDFKQHANVLRVFVGESSSEQASDTVWVLETNLDDVPGEIIGFTQERLFQLGALDVYCIPMQMKKGRPGVMFGIIAPIEKVGELETELIRQTGTLGIRRYQAQRTKLQREATTLDSPWGPVQAKRAWRTAGVEFVSPEYEDCARIAREHNVPLREVYETCLAATRQRSAQTIS